MSSAKSSESPEARFKRIAEKRTNDILDKIRVLGNLANRRNYGYNKKDIDNIFTVISKKLKVTRSIFHTDEQTRFTFQPK